METGRAAQAIAPLEEGLEVVEKQGGDPQVAAEIRSSLARTLWDTPRERKRARALAEAARDQLDGATGGSLKLREKIERWLDSPGSR